MKKRVRRLLNEYCESRGLSDQCDGCALDDGEIPNACDFKEAPDEDIDKMVKKVKKGGVKFEKV